MTEPKILLINPIGVQGTVTPELTALVGTATTAASDAADDAVQTGLDRVATAADVVAADAARVAAETAREVALAGAGAVGSYAATTLAAAITAGIAGVADGAVFRASGDDVDLVETRRRAGAGSTLLWQEPKSQAVTSQLGGFATQLGRAVAPSSGTSATANFTFAIINTATEDGAVTRFWLWTNAAGTVKLKIFSKVGTTYGFRAEKTLTCAASGLNTFDAAALGVIPIYAGDVMGVYSADAGVVTFTNATSEGSGIWNTSGDVRGATAPTVVTGVRVEAGIEITHTSLKARAAETEKALAAAASKADSAAGVLAAQASAAMIADGVEPALLLDFENGVYLTGGDADDPTLFDLNDVLVFSRLGAASYRARNGGLVSAGVNVPRFDYSSGRRGLYIEGARTNLFLNSDVGATQTITVAATAYTLSFAGTGSITLSGVSTAGPLVGTGSGRVQLTFTPTAGILTLTIAGSATEVQLEAGGSATSIIRTTGTSASRAAETVTLSSALFSALALGSEYTVFAEYSKGIVGDIDATSVQGAAFYGPQDGRGIQTVSNGTTQVSSTATAADATFKRLVAAYKLNDFAVTINGVSPAIDAVGTMPSTAPLRLRIGSDRSGNYNNGILMRLAIYKKRLSNAAIVALSAGGSVVAGSVALAPNSRVLTVSDHAGIAERSNTRLRFLRPITDIYAQENAAPNARVSLVTDATLIEFDLTWNGLNNPGSPNRNSVGCVLVDGVEVSTFSSPTAYGVSGTSTATVALPGTPAEVSILWPYGDSVEMTALRLQGGTFASPAVRPNRAIAACGDSITMGYTVPKATQTWAHLLGAAVDRRIINLANGYRKANGADALALAVTDADTAIYMIGYNDFAAQTPIVTFQSEVSAWIANARATRPAMRLLVGGPFYSPNSAAITLASYRSAVQAAVTAALSGGVTNLVYVDGLATMTNANTSLNADLVHPNATGAAEIAAYFAGVV